MNSPASPSDARGQSAFELLHPKIQQWIWDAGWEQLRVTQAQAIPPILRGDRNVIVAAATAGGKTEAAWLPICSALAREDEAGNTEPGIRALYVSPLKALINDQYTRLSDLCDYVDIPVHRRHGDVPAGERRHLYEHPSGVLLITPESIEALFVNQGTLIPGLFRALRYVVIDEMHSFLGTERGAQLQSLLHRIELAIRRQVPRIGLSATLADPAHAAEFLVPGEGESVVFAAGTGEDRTRIRMQLRGYLIPGPKDDRRRNSGVLDGDDTPQEDPPGAGSEPEPEEEEPDVEAITTHLFRTLRHTDNLVFANSRNFVEKYAGRLKRLADREQLPNTFFPHHGSLSKALREDVERRLKSTDQVATAICTSTLELGIDIGSADSVAQIGSPGSVSALRQRLGRSGRRGDPAVLRLYLSEPDINAHSSPIDQLRAETFEAVAIIELLLEKWYEPPNTSSLHLSTLIQQVLSMIAQHGGARAADLFRVLCQYGPFEHVHKQMFMQLLRDMATADLIMQAADGTLLHGATGERLVNHYSFYTAFVTAEEFRLVANGRTLGTLPIDYPLEIGGLLVFAGQGWRVMRIDDHAKVIELERARGGNPPHFTGSSIQIADGIRKKMRDIYESTHVPAYLDPTAKQFLREGRDAFQRFHLDRTPFVQDGNDVLIFPWRGDIVMNTLVMVLRRERIDTAQNGLALECRHASTTQMMDVLQSLMRRPPPDARDLAAMVRNKAKDKYDIYLGEELLNEAYAARDLDVAATWSMPFTMLPSENP